MIGRPLHRYGVVTSTNDIARELAAQGAAEGTTVIAEEQSNGRGSRGRVWLASAGENLLFSVVLRPDVPRERWGELAFVAAIAVAQSLTSFGADARIKWPNDVRIGGRKVAGMLIEATTDAAILGIGINANWNCLPAEIKDTATSLSIELGAEIDFDQLLASVLAELDIAYAVYRARGFEKTLEDWKQLEESTGSTVTVTIDGNTISGIACGIDLDGSLVVETPNGERQSISAASIFAV